VLIYVAFDAAPDRIRRPAHDRPEEIPGDGALEGPAEGVLRHYKERILADGIG
jgi:hypothetical protein